MIFFFLSTEKSFVNKTHTLTDVYLQLTTNNEVKVFVNTIKN